MNISIITSFVIGGLLLLAALTLNNQVMQHTSESTLDMITKNRIDLITQTITNDFQKIGYNVTPPFPVFVNMKDNSIQFHTDNFDNDNRPFSKVTWNFSIAKPINNTTNPNDYELSRSDNATNGSGNMDVVFPVTYFSLEYLDKAGNIIANPNANKSSVRQIRVELICESAEPYGQDNNGNDLYHRSVWKKTFHPENLQF